MGRRHRIARFAIALCVLSVIGPWLHVAVHDHLLAHHHDSFGRTVAHHDHDPVGRAFADAVRETARDGASRIVAPGSLHELTHEQVALAVLAPVVTRSLPVDQPTLLVETGDATVVISRQSSAASARGPPV